MVSGPVKVPRKREESLAADLDGLPGEELLFWYRDKVIMEQERRTVIAVRYTTAPLAAAAN